MPGPELRAFHSRRVRALKLFQTPKVSPLMSILVYVDALRELRTADQRS